MENNLDRNNDLRGLRLPTGAPLSESTRNAAIIKILNDPLCMVMYVNSNDRAFILP